MQCDASCLLLLSLVVLFYFNDDDDDDDDDIIVIYWQLDVLPAYRHFVLCCYANSRHSSLVPAIHWKVLC